MPVTSPFIPALNFTPRLLDAESGHAAFEGVAEAFHAVHGQDGGAAVVNDQLKLTASALPATSFTRGTSAPAIAWKNAYSIPLIVLTLKLTPFPSRVIPASSAAPERFGSIAWRPVALVPAAMLKFSLLPSQANDPNEEALRPSGQFSICTLETIGTPRACADATTARASKESGKSVCALMV